MPWQEVEDAVGDERGSAECLCPSGASSSEFCCYVRALALGKTQRGRRHRPHDPLLQQCDDLALGRRRAYFGAAGLDCHVEFAAHAEASRQINSRFDREAGAIDERAMVVGLERVEVGAGAMNLAADRMAGARDELLPKAGAPE